MLILPTERVSKQVWRGDQPECCPTPKIGRLTERGWSKQETRKNIERRKGSGWVAAGSHKQSRSGFKSTVCRFEKQKFVRPLKCRTRACVCVCVCVCVFVRVCMRDSVCVVVRVLNFRVFWNFSDMELSFKSKIVDLEVQLKQVTSQHAEALLDQEMKAAELVESEQGLVQKLTTERNSYKAKSDGLAKWEIWSLDNIVLRTYVSVRCMSCIPKIGTLKSCLDNRSRNQPMTKKWAKRFKD